MKAYIMICIRGCVSTGNPYEGVAVANGADATTACPDVITTDVDRLVMEFMSKDRFAATPTTPGGWDEVVNVNDLTSTDATLHIISKSQATAGTVVGPDISYGADTNEWFAHGIAWVPAVTGGGGTINTQTLSSTLDVADASAQFLVLNRLLESSIDLFDAFVATIGGNVIRTLEDAIAVTDNALLSALHYRLAQDTITLSEGALETYITTNLVTDDEIELADAMVRFAMFRRLASDDVTVTDEIISSIVNYVVREAVLSSTITVVDEELHSAFHERLLESALSLFDESQSEAQRFIMLSDALSVDDSATATYIPDNGPPPPLVNPVIRMGADQPLIDIGGYAVN